jgi:2-dehydropantoate 2-reductase
MMTNRPIVVAGAGAIGCFVGGTLAAAGRRVAFLVRPRVKAEIERFGLLLTDFDGSEKKLSPDQLALSEDPAIFHSAGIVLVTVKSADTAGVADLIAQHAPQDAVIVSLQNGIGNVAVLRERVGDRRVLAGMVPFNVVGMGEEQRAQRLVRPAARRAIGQPRMAKVVRRPDGGGAGCDESRRHHAGFGDADPVVLDAHLAETA